MANKTAHFTKKLFLISALLVLVFASSLQIHAQDTTGCASFHVIQRGENLFRIALRYGLPIQTIAQANGISDITRIYAGDTLCIPPGGRDTQSASGATTEDTNTENLANDPELNPNANACLEGGSMAGKCNSDWEWTCGWHLIRLENGLISQDEFPGGCFSLINEASASSPCEPQRDVFRLEPLAPTASVSAPGVLGNDGSCTQVVSSSSATELSSSIGTVISLTVNSNGSFSYQVTDPGTIFVFTYTTESGATATVRVEHDCVLAGGC